jgi:hypothetical protein
MELKASSRKEEKQREEEINGRRLKKKEAFKGTATSGNWSLKLPDSYNLVLNTLSFFFHINFSVYLGFYELCFFGFWLV